MKTKLTLSVEEGLIRKAKLYAEEQGTSVSSLVERFFAVIKQRPDVEANENTAFTKALRGTIPEGDGAEDEYVRYLNEKHR